MRSCVVDDDRPCKVVDTEKDRVGEYRRPVKGMERRGREINWREEIEADTMKVDNRGI